MFPFSLISATPFADPLPLPTWDQTDPLSVLSPLGGELFTATGGGEQPATLCSPATTQSPPPGVDPEAASPTSSPILGRGQRQKKPPASLKDYVCHTTQAIHPPASSTPTIGSRDPRYPLANYVSNHSFSGAHSKFLNAVSAMIEPRSYKVASHDPKWRAAMRTEIDALEANGTWTMKDLPPGKKAIGSKWVYKIKYNSDRIVERLKARVVVRGDTQVAGLDYTETFAPVAKMVSVRLFLAVVVAKNLELHQMDINNAFLYGDLHEEVYMRPPPGFSSPSGPNKVCRLRKSLYGLRQSPRNWFAMLASALKSYGFLQSHADHTLFTYHKGDVFLFVLVYVDDLILAGNDSASCSMFKRYLNDCFKLKDLDPLKYFLGIEAARGSVVYSCLRGNMHSTFYLSLVCQLPDPLHSQWNKTMRWHLLMVLFLMIPVLTAALLVILSSSPSSGPIYVI